VKGPYENNFKERVYIVACCVIVWKYAHARAHTHTQLPRANHESKPYKHLSITIACYALLSL